MLNYLTLLLHHLSTIIRDKKEGYETVIPIIRAYMPSLFKTTSDLGRIFTSRLYLMSRVKYVQQNNIPQIISNIDLHLSVIRIN